MQHLEKIVPHEYQSMADIITVEDIFHRTIVGSFRPACTRRIKELHHLQHLNMLLGPLYYFAIYIKGFHDQRWECILHVSQNFFSLYYSGGRQCEFDVCSRFARSSSLFEKRFCSIRVFLAGDDITKELYYTLK